MFNFLAVAIFNTFYAGKITIVDGGPPPRPLFWIVLIVNTLFIYLWIS